MHRYYFTLYPSSSLTINLRTILEYFLESLNHILFPRFFHAIGYSALLHHKIGLTIIDTRVYTYQHQAFINAIFKSRSWRIYFNRNEMIVLPFLPLFFTTVFLTFPFFLTLLKIYKQRFISSNFSYKTPEVWRILDKLSIGAQGINNKL